MKEITITYIPQQNPKKVQKGSRSSSTATKSQTKSHNNPSSDPTQRVQSENRVVIIDHDSDRGEPEEIETGNKDPELNDTSCHTKDDASEKSVNSKDKLGKCIIYLEVRH